MRLIKVFQLVLLLATTSLIVAATPGCHKHHTSLVSRGPTSTASKRLRLLLIAPDSFMAQTKQASAMTTQSLRDSTAQASKVDAPIKEQRVFAGTGNRRLLETFPGGVAAPNNFLAQSKHASSLVTKDLRETESRAAEFSKATQDRFADKKFLP